MISLALILFAAAIAHVFSSLLRVSSIPLFVVMGILLSASGLINDTSDIQHTLLLGLTFLVFIAGTELNPERTHVQLVTAVKVGVFQFTLLGVSSFLIAQVFYLELIPSLYLGLAIAASSTLVVVRILQRRRQVYESFGRLVLGVLLIQDLIAICFIALLSANELRAELILVNILIVAGIFVLSWLFQKFIAPFLFVTLKLDEETLLLVSLTVLFSFSFLSKSFGLPFVVGAFFAGFALSSFPVHGIVQSQLITLSDFFVAVFFVSLGTALVLPTEYYLLLSFVMITLVIIATPLIVIIIAERAGLTTRGAFQAGLLLAQTSEFSIVIGIIGFEAGHIDQELLSVIALTTVITMILTPFLATDTVAWKLTKLRPFLKEKPVVGTPEAHILFLGFGQSIQKLVSALDEDTRKRVMVIDYDPGALRKLDSLNVHYTRGDAADFRVLDACSAKHATLVISTLSNMRDNQAIVRYLKDVPVIVRVLEDFDASLIKNSGGIPVLSSRLASEETIKWIKEYFSDEKEQVSSL
jgi:Kef-type K+ transport system membrane component KefB